MNVTTVKKTRPMRRKRADGPRITIRLKPNQALRLERLGAIERRHFAGFYRDRLEEWLGQWEREHPSPDGRKLRVV